jgi:predicted XRE-type DNA-binding protein
MGKKRLALTDQLRCAIDASPLSRYRICQELGINQSSMSRFMHRQAGLTVDALDALADFLDLQLAAGKRRPNKG